MTQERAFLRRQFLKQAGLAAGALWTGARKGGTAESRTGSRLHVASNQFSWYVFYRRDNRSFNDSLDSGLKDVKSSGLDGLEPIITDPKQIDNLAALLRKHHLEMRSLYVNSTLHVEEQAGRSIDQVLAIARKAKQVGTRIIVTNPSPIRWGGEENKSDEQLRVQAAALNRLGREISALGLTLAYHNHDIELRNAAREFHHMMVGTEARYVTLCLDAHWIYRGAGNSAVALFDVAKLYGSRVTELHLRQSADGVWSETFGDGDIDYCALARHLLKIGVKPHLVMEQAVENGTPKTVGPVEAHRRSAAYARRILAGFRGG